MGESTFSMNYEFAVLGIGVNLQLSGGESFPMIEDEPVEKEAVEKKKNFFEEFVENIKPSGLVVSAIFGAIGVIAAVVAAPLTGAAAVIGGAIAIGATVAAAFTELYTYGTALVDTITGHETEDEVFLETVLTIGATTFVLVSGMAAIAGLAAVGGSGGGSLAVAGGGTMALEGGLIIGAEGAIAKALEVIIGGNLTGAIAVAASMGSNEGESDSKVSQESDMRKQSNEQLQKSKESYEKLIEEHQKKLDDYIKDPYAHDNKGILENAPNQEIRDKIIQGRIDALQKQINKQQGELEKIIDLLRERGVSN